MAPGTRASNPGRSPQELFVPYTEDDKEDDEGYNEKGDEKHTQL